MSDQVPSKIDLRHTESRVVFYFCDCSLDKKYSFYGLNKEKATKLINRLKHIERIEWKQFSNSSQRRNGLTCEKKGSESFNMINDQNSCLERKIVEQFYFHFYVEKIGLFRIFGYQRDQFFCITHIDSNGSIHH